MRLGFSPLVFVAAGALAAGCQESPAAQAPTSATPAGKPTPPVRASAAPSSSAPPALPKDPAARARALTQRTILIDGHIDVPYRLQMTLLPDGGVGEDISKRTKDGDFDYERARRGGLDAPFMSIYTPARYESKGAKAHADKLIDMVEGFTKRWPDKFAIARTPDEVRAHFKQGKMSMPMGMENGSPIERNIDNVRHFYDRGIRYITLAHSKDNHLSDSSYDHKNSHGGLSEFGKLVVGEMNRLGIMVDVSHISDAAVRDVFEATRVPVIASHSSCRRFTPKFKRNMSDELIRQLAKNGGVIQINFGSGFLDNDIRKTRDRYWSELGALAIKKKIKRGTPAWRKLSKQYQKDHVGPYATVGQVADHIMHVVKLVGVEHVGLGSDFDGVGDSLPTGLKDVSAYPNLVRVLIERGLDDASIKKLLSGNVLRVWSAAEAYAKPRRDQPAE